MEMAEVVSDFGNPGVLILINTAKILSKNIMEKANDALDSIGDQSRCEKTLIHLRLQSNNRLLQTASIGAPGQSNLNMQGGGCNSMSMILSVNGAIMGMAYNSDQNANRHLMHITGTVVLDRLFPSMVPTESTNPNSPSILISILKPQNYTYVKNIVKNLPRFGYDCAISFLRESFISDYCKYQGMGESNEERLMKNEECLSGFQPLIFILHYSIFIPKGGFMDTKTDEELMLSVGEGDEAAFNILVDRHYQNILNFIYRFVGNQELSKDLCQETFVRLWRSAPNYRPLAKFTTYLYCIAKNVCLKELAKIQRLPQISSLDEPAFEDNNDFHTVGEEIEDTRHSPEEDVLAKELGKKIQEAIASLSEEHKLVFILTEYHGLSYQQVAEVVQCPVGTVASRKNAAIRKLQKILSQYK